MKLVLLSVISVFAICSAVNAQESARPATVRTVDGTGTATVKQAPTIMRMTIQFKETGNDTANALTNLKAKRDEAKAHLVTLGAKEGSMREGTPSIAGEDPQTARMMAQAMSSRGGGRKKKKATQVKVSVMGSLTCEWALPSGSTEELLEFVHSTKEKIQAADLTGQKDQKSLSAEEQEELEEMEMMQNQFGERPDAKPGEPSFLFLAKISPEEQRKAQASAFRNARKQADNLVTAAGAKLGKLRTLQSSQDANMAMQMMSYGRYGMGNDDQVEDDNSDDNEDTGKSQTCKAVKFNFTVHATFDIEES